MINFYDLKNKCIDDKCSSFKFDHLHKIDKKGEYKIFCQYDKCDYQPFPHLHKDNQITFNLEDEF